MSVSIDDLTKEMSQLIIKKPVSISTAPSWLDSCVATFEKQEKITSKPQNYQELRKVFFVWMKALQEEMQLKGTAAQESVRWRVVDYKSWFELKIKEALNELHRVRMDEGDAFASNVQQMRKQYQDLLQIVPKKSELTHNFEIFTKNAVLFVARYNKKSPNPEKDTQVLWKDLSPEEASLNMRWMFNNDWTFRICYPQEKYELNTVVGFRFDLTLEMCLKYHPCTVDVLHPQLFKDACEGNWVIASDSKGCRMLQKVGKDVVERQCPKTFEEFHKQYPLDTFLLSALQSVKGDGSGKEKKKSA